MAEVFSEWLEKLKSKADIAEVVSHYVSLQERGSRKWACCPFHHEKRRPFVFTSSPSLITVSVAERGATQYRSCRR